MFQKKVALPLISSLITLGLPVNDSWAKVVKLYRNGQGCVVGLSRGITDKGGIEGKELRAKKYPSHRSMAKGFQRIIL